MQPLGTRLRPWTMDGGWIKGSFDPWQRSLFVPSVSSANTKEKGPLLAGKETPGQWLQKFVRISSRKHGEMSSFRLNNGFRLQKTNRAAIRWKQPPIKPSHHVSRDKILHDSWSITATAILREKKALGTRLGVSKSVRHFDYFKIKKPIG